MTPISVRRGKVWDVYNFNHYEPKARPPNSGRSKNAHIVESRVQVRSAMTYGRSSTAARRRASPSDQKMGLDVVMDAPVPKTNCRSSNAICDGT